MQCGEHAAYLFSSSLFSLYFLGMHILLFFYFIFHIGHMGGGWYSFTVIPSVHVRRFDVCFSVWGEHVGRRVVVTAWVVWKDFLITSCLCPKHFPLPSCTTGPQGSAGARVGRYYLHVRENERKEKLDEWFTALQSCKPSTEMPNSDGAPNVYFINRFACLPQTRTPGPCTSIWEIRSQAA